MSKRVCFAEDSKNFDGSSPIVIEIYKIVSGFFNSPSMNIKKIGLSQDVIDRLLENNMNSRIRSLTRITTSIIGKDSIIPIKNHEDCLKVCGNKEILRKCLDNLKLAIANITNIEQEDEVTSNINIYDEEENALRMLWEKKCGNKICVEKNCCLDAKTLKKKKRNASLIRDGSKDYGICIDYRHLSYIINMASIVEKGIEYLDFEEDFFDKMMNLDKLVMA